MRKSWGHSAQRTQPDETPDFLGALATLALATQARAPPAYPERPIRFIVELAPGGGTDVISREIAARLLADLG